MSYEEIRKEIEELGDLQDNICMSKMTVEEANEIPVKIEFLHLLLRNYNCFSGGVCSASKGRQERFELDKIKNMESRYSYLSDIFDKYFKKD